VFRMSGLSSNGFAGTLEAVEQLIHPDDREPMRARRAAALETPGPYENAFRIRRPDGEERWLELRGKIRRSPGGAPLSIFGVVWDVTERKVIEAEHDRLVSIIEESPDIIKSATPDGRVLYLNAAGRRKLGIGATEVIRHLHMKDIRTPEAWRKTLEVQLPMAARYGSWSGESVLLARDGREVPVSQVIVAHKDAHGDVAYYSTMCRDITQQQRAAERQLLLVRELNHRTNNLLAVIRSIVSSTFVDDRPVDEARDVLLERLQALGRVHALLGQTQWNGASLQNLIDEELAAIIGRGRIEGPPVTLTAEATQTFALVLHELATNAAKYGALSVPKGEVVVSWGIRGEGDQACLRFLWRERGGPPVAPPQREGFGRMLLVDVAALDFATRPRLAFDKEGLRYEFEAPLARVAEPKSPAGATAPLANG
jgi:PAS domain S-box-containing protein